MAQDIDFSTAQWYRGSDRPAPNAPKDSSYALPDLSWFGHPFMDGLRKIAQRLPAKITVDEGTVHLSYAQLYGIGLPLEPCIRPIEPAGGASPRRGGLRRVADRGSPAAQSALGAAFALDRPAPPRSLAGQDRFLSQLPPTALISQICAQNSPPRQCGSWRCVDACHEHRRQDYSPATAGEADRRGGPRSQAHHAPRQQARSRSCHGHGRQPLEQRSNRQSAW